MLISYLSNHLMMLLIPFVIWENYIGEKMLFSWVRRLHSELLYLSLGCLSSPAAPTPTCFLFGMLLSSGVTAFSTGEVQPDATR